MQYEYVSKNPNSLRPDKNQPRTHKDEEKAREMADSIKTVGIINPIEIDENDVIITGETRWRAAKIAGLESIPCKVLRELTKRERFRRQVIENVHNNTMNPWDTAIALAGLLKEHLPDKEIDPESEEYSDSINKLSKEIGKNRKFIKEHLDILTLSAPLQKAVKEGMPRTSVDVLRWVSVKYHKRLEDKMLKEKVGRDGMREIVRAINRRDDLADEILSVDYTGKYASEIMAITRGIAPSFSDVMPAAKTTVSDINELFIKLCDYLDKNSLDDLPDLYKPILKINALLTISQLQRWIEGRKIKVEPKRLPITEEK